MCLAAPARIIDLDNYTAIIDIMGVESTVNVQLIENLKIGDYILVHAGCAIQKLDEDSFDELQRIFQSIFNSEGKYE